MQVLVQCTFASRCVNPVVPREMLTRPCDACTWFKFRTLYVLSERDTRIHASYNVRLHRAASARSFAGNGRHASRRPAPCALADVRSHHVRVVEHARARRERGSVRSSDLLQHCS